MSLPYLQPYLGLSNGLNTLHAAGGPGGAVGGWVELGRTTLGSPATSLAVSSLSDKRYYMYIWSHLYNSSGYDSKLRLNGDTGSNYAFRGSLNGASDVTAASQTSIDHSVVTGTEPITFGMGYLANYSTKEKLNIAHIAANSTNGAGTAPTRRERVGKHAQTSNPISTIDVLSAAGSVATGSELVVLGWDPADSHTNNFWEELASVDLSGGAADTISSGTITAKKYLWVQAWVEGSGQLNDVAMRFNSDSGNNYSRRYSMNGAADGTDTSQPYVEVEQGAAFTNINGFFNAFIVNNTSNEKLTISHWIDESTAGAATAPRRGEAVGKWANTSTQITQIDVVQNGTGDFGTKTILKVFGSD